MSSKNFLVYRWEDISNAGELNLKAGRQPSNPASD
jgi:hypothetical protein